MWAIVQIASTSTITTIPSGWAQHGTTLTVGSRSFTVWKKIASGEGATWTWIVGPSTTWVGQAIAFSGVDTTTPVSASAQQVTPGATSIVHAAISPADTNTMLVTLCGLASNAPFTTDAAMIEVQDAGQGSNRLSIAYQQLTASGSTGTRTHSWAPTVDNCGGHIIALKPAAAAVASTVSLLVAGP
jgi:hypothetical protein